MTIKINDIPPEGLTLELEHKLDLFNEGTASTAFTAALSIKPTGSGFLNITGWVKAEPTLECSRCLINFPHKIDAGMDINLAPVSSMGASPEHELERSDLDVEFYQGEQIDPVELVKEQLLISIPMVPLHAPDCKGLCPACGTNLNEADCGCQKEGHGEFGAFSVLKDLFKK